MGQTGQNDEPLSLLDLAEVLRDKYGEEEAKAVFQEARDRLRERRRKLNEAAQELLTATASMQTKLWYDEQRGGNSNEVYC